MNLKESKITVVIPNYNGLKYLKTCLISIENIKFDFLDVVIVDNGSNNETIEYLKNKVKNTYSNIQYHLIVNKKNLGFSKAVNQGIVFSKKLNSKYVCLLNNDVEVTENFFFKLQEAIEKDAKIFSVSSKMLKFHEREIVDDAGDEYTLFGWTHKNGDGKNSNKFNKSYEVFSACGGAAIYRKDILEDIGYFDEEFFTYLEDVDIGYRARINGYKNIFTHDAVVYHIGSGTTGSKHNEFKVKIAVRNNIWLIYKNMPWPQVVLNIGFLCLGFLIKYIFFLKKGYGKLYLDGLKEGIKNRKKIEKIAFKGENLLNYCKIEYRLIINCFKLLK